MPMDFRLLRPTRAAPSGPPAYGFSVLQTYNPNIFFQFPDTQYLTPSDPTSSIGEVTNVVQLALACSTYGIPMAVDWTLIGCTYNPPLNLQTSYYYAVDQDPGSAWGLPVGSDFHPDLTQVTESVRYNWPGEPNRSLMFNVNGDCVSVYTMLGEDNLFSTSRAMPVLGGVQILFDTRQYKISLNPSLGAAWCVRRNISLDNNGDFFTAGSDVLQWEDIYYFASGYAADSIVPGNRLCDTYDQTPGCYPLVFSGGAPNSLWAQGGS